MISVIVPIYNAEKRVAKCIESILKQTHKNLQVLLINDGSTDGSLEICYNFRSLDNRITVIDKENEGVSAARNYGIKLAEGDYIGFVDSDDYIEKEMYEVLLNRIHEDDSQACALTMHTINRFGKYNNNPNSKISGVAALKSLFYLSFPTSLWAYLYTREVVKDNYLNEEIHYFEDFEFNTRILQNSKNISLCDQKLYNYMSNEESINSQDINDKKITCLNIYNELIETIQSTKIVKYATFFRAYFLINVIVSLYESKNIHKKYYSIVNKQAKFLTWKIFFSKHVPPKYKIVICMCAVNTRLTCRLLRFIKRNEY